MYDLIVIGDGLAARCFLYELSKTESEAKILQIYSEDKAPACTFKTTSHVCLNGVKEGVSPLGDLLFESYMLTESFYKTQKPDGVYPGHQYSICRDGEEGKDDFERRYGLVQKFEAFSNGIDVSNEDHWGMMWENFLIDPKALMNWLKTRYTPKLNIEVKEAFANHEKIINEQVVVSTDKGEFVSNKLLLCAGAYSKTLEKDFDFDLLTRSKVAPGQYLTFSDIDWGEENFSISKGKYNLIYRAYNKTIMIGGTTLKADDDINDLTPLKHEYDEVQKILGDSKKLPAFEEGLVRHGLRHKGVKRTPFWGVMQEGVEESDARIFGMFSLYKNGFTFPFLGAQKLVEIMNL